VRIGGFKESREYDSLKRDGVEHWQEGLWGLGKE
jgi:hypothetical protein